MSDSSTSMRRRETVRDNEARAGAGGTEQCVVFISLKGSQFGCVGAGRMKDGGAIRLKPVGSSAFYAGSNAIRGPMPRVD